MTQSKWMRVLLIAAIRQRRILRQSELAFIALACLVGIGAGLLTFGQQFIAHGLQRLLYGIDANRLSALAAIDHPWRLLALPLGGLSLVGVAYALRKRRAPIDVVEGNAMHGGRIPLRDNLIISVQTMLSNGTGASVGLEAAYAQMGGGLGSLAGQWMHLRRKDLRTLVGAGAGAAIGAAFGAPLTGAFYAFEIVIGSYVPASIAPVMAASLMGTVASRWLGVEPYLIATSASLNLTFTDYLAYAALGLLCAALGIFIMRLVTAAEMNVQGSKLLGRWKPLVGGLLLIPIAYISPQALSSGHGALHLDLLLRPALSVLLVIIACKIAASVISLSFGFRGGLFFASLFLGSVVGQAFAQAINLLGLGFTLDPVDAALVGMAALSVSIVGGPMTLAMLALEITHNFALTGVVLTAAILSTAATREAFGYSFSTWRLHLRGSSMRSARDIGWSISLTAGRVMRRDWVSIEETAKVREFRRRVPLGSASKAILNDRQGCYAGIVSTATAHREDIAPDAPLSSIATLKDFALVPATRIDDVLKSFDRHAVDELAVIDANDSVIGVVTEKYARRRYAEEIELSQRELFGEM